ncbi:hypothetical protein [Clostridium beijerinckii]|nr:hypothetical protein [Clostridium beijerinckii]
MEDKNIIEVRLDTNDLDKTIKKVSQLKSLLLEVREIINSLKI